jgi:hypothetical protein
LDEEMGIGDRIPLFGLKIKLKKNLFSGNSHGGLGIISYSDG